MKFIPELMLRIRGDRQRGVIRAFVILADGSEWELSTICIRICDSDKQAFNEWHEVVKSAWARWIETRIGIKPHMVAQRPHESN